MEKQEQKEPSLEEAFQELEAIIEKMQNREVTLEESFSLYEQGIHKLKFCNEKIDIYLARGLTAGSQHLDEDEYVQVKAYTVQELTERIYAGEIQDSKTVAAIMAYKDKYRGEM